MTPTLPSDYRFYQPENAM